MSLTVLISDKLSKLNLHIINKKIYHDDYLRKEAVRLMAPVLQRYNELILNYPTEADHRKAEENKILFIKMIYWLKLHKKPYRRILDIGGRGGLFAYYCCCYGHEAYVSDLPEVLHKSPNRELFDLFQVNSIPLKIEPFTQTKANNIRFDLVTGFRTRFHSKLPFETGKKNEEHWGIGEWDYFLKDIAQNILREDGKIFFMLNRLQERNNKEYVPQKLSDYFRLKGGVLRQQYLLFTSMEKLLS